MNCFQNPNEMKFLNKIPVFFTFVICLLGTTQSISQFTDDFSDGDITINPVWQGNVEDFIINSSYQLQLDASEAGESVIYTDYQLADSMEWNFYFKMDFSPSVSNKLRVYLMSDNSGLSLSNGYFIEIGENGSTDNLKFFKTSSGISTLLAQGTKGLFSEQPAEAKIKITRTNNGHWVFYLDKNNGFPSKDFETIDTTYAFTNCYFILDCIYSATRKDKFFFDDIDVIYYQPDKTPPKVIMAEMLDIRHLKVKFNEQLDEATVYNKDNFTLTKQSNPIKSINFDTLKPNELIIEFTNDLSGSVIYNLEISNIEDLSGNAIVKENVQFYLIEQALKGDLIINEVLFNPLSGGSDFIELINISKKIIDLKGLRIYNSSINKFETIEISQVMRENEYICISKDTSNIRLNYFVPQNAKLLQNAIPSLDDDNGNVNIYSLSPNNDKILIDSFNYDENMHSSFLIDNNGYSLERKNPYSNTNDIFNWTSAASDVGGATPGYSNSDYYAINDSLNGITLSNKIFSPDQDGYNDELKIEYNLNSIDNIINVSIFDSKGRYITKIANNYLIGKQGFITWDGSIGDKKIAGLGLYILYISITNQNGNNINGKYPIVIANKLK